MKKLLVIGLALSPVFVIRWIPGVILTDRQQTELFLQLLAMVALSLHCWKGCNVSLTAKNKYAGMFLLWSVISYLCHGLQPYSTSYVSQIMVWTLLLILACEHIEKHEVESALKWICGTAIFAVVFIGLQVTRVFPLRIGKLVISPTIDVLGNLCEPFWWDIGFSGVIGQPNLTGAYLAVAAPLFMVYCKFTKLPLLIKIGKAKLEVTKWPVGLILVLTCIGLTKSFMAVLTAAAGLFFFEWFREDRNKLKLKRIGIAIFIFIPIFLRYVHFPDWKSRWYAVKFIASRWTLFGHGFGEFAKEKLRRAPDVTVGAVMQQAHCDYAQCFDAVGLFGLTICLCYMATRFEKFLFMRKRSPMVVALMSSWVALFVNCIGNFGFHHGTLALQFLVIIALTEVVLYESGNRDIGFIGTLSSQLYKFFSSKQVRQLEMGSREKKAYPFA